MNLTSSKKLPGEAMGSPLKTDTMQTLRRQILNSLVIFTAAFGLLDYLLVVIRSYKQTPFPAFVIYTAAVAWMLVIAVFRKLPYGLRAYSLIAMLYLLGLTSFLQGGVTTDGAIFLLAFVFLTSLLIGSWGAVVSAVIAIVTSTVVAVLMSLHIVIPSTVFSSDDGSAWINRVAVIFLLCLVVGYAISNMLRGLQRNLDQAAATANELEKDQEFLRKHTQDLERRSQQIRAAAEISRSISGVLTIDKLLQESVELIVMRFNLYYVGLFLVDETERSAVLQAGTGEAGQAMLAEHHKLAVADSSMIGWTIAHKQARIALDVGKDAVRFVNPHLPATHSELALPLISGDQVIGALTVQSSRSEAFDDDDIAILQNIADTLAIALQNARLFQETQAALEELRISQRSYVAKTWGENAHEGEQFEYVANPSVLRPSDLGASIDVPLTLREQIIGQLHLEGDQDWTPEEQSLIEAVASQAALAMENARLLEESQQAALRERLVAEITGKVWSSPNTDFILQTAVKELARALRTDDAVIELNLD